MEYIDFKAGRHSFYYLKYHLVVVTKNSYPILNEPLKSRLLELSKQIINEYWSCELSETIVESDFIHLLFEAPPQVQPSKLANNYKTVSSRIMRKEFSDVLSQYDTEPYFWAYSYFFCTDGAHAQDMVTRYISQQREQNTKKGANHA